MTNKETVSIRIDPKLWKEAKIFAIKSNVKISHLVEKALKKEIKN
jgi:predicted HicB family RNase H-like nuclease